MAQLTRERGFLVECFAPGISTQAAEAEVERVRVAVDSLCAVGRLIEYLDAVLLPSDEVILHRFRAFSAADVHEASVLAGIDFERVVPTVTWERRPVASAANVGDHPISPATPAP